MYDDNSEDEIEPAAIGLGIVVALLLSAVQVMSISPGTSPLGTGCSSIGQMGSPFSRLIIQQENSI